MIKLSEEGTLKADRQKFRPLIANSQVVKAKEKSLKETESAPPVNTQMIRKGKIFIANGKKVSVVWIDSPSSHSIP